MSKHVQEYRVYIEDTDMMQIVYHSNYLKYGERARTEWLRSRGFSLTNMAKDDTYFAVKHLAIDYRAPAYMEDMICVETDVQLTGFCQLEFDQRIYNQHRQLLTVLTVNVVCVNAKMSPKRLPKELSKEFIA